ncbi:MAG: thiol reductant ABC exporter subunit CydD [Acidimicrobiales bacterium]
MGPKDFIALDPQARRFYNLGLCFAALSSFALIAWTLLLASGITRFIEKQSVKGPVAVLIALLVLRVIARFLSAQALSRSSSLLRSNVRLTLIRSWIQTGTRSAPTFAQTEPNSRQSAVGEDATLFGSGVDALDGYITSFLPARSLAAVIPLVTFIVIGLLDPWTLLILLFAGPMMVLLLAIIGSRTKLLADRRFRELGWLRSFYLDMVRGIPTLRVFDRANESALTIQELSDRFGRTTMDVLRTAFQTSLVIEWAATAATALVAVQISFRMIDGQITYFAALGVLMLTPEFFAPLRNLAVEYHAGQTGNAALAQISQVLPAPERSTPESTQSFPLVTPLAEPNTSTSMLIGPIRFEAVSYQHPGAEHSLLTNLTFTIEPGETVALVGPSGIGKSTVIELLLGRLQPTGGKITIGGRPLNELDHTRWLATITSVTQDPFLFHGSIRENITISNSLATESEYDVALSASQTSEFVNELPGGSETTVGENGVTLSGGQRQRIAIARALLRDAPLVVLDEFTAHLDPVTEMKVVGSLRPFLEDRTALIVAHREATLTLADRVLFMNQTGLQEVPQ